jgi:hypothetical protein
LVALQKDSHLTMTDEYHDGPGKNKGNVAMRAVVVVDALWVGSSSSFSAVQQVLKLGESSTIGIGVSLLSTTVLTSIAVAVAAWLVETGWSWRWYWCWWWCYAEKLIDRIVPVYRPIVATGKGLVVMVMMLLLVVMLVESSSRSVGKEKQ